MRALASLGQLVSSYGASNDAKGKVRCGGLGVSRLPWQITDSPRFKHRGILVDTARHFLSVKTLRKIVDGMALSKMNVVRTLTGSCCCCCCCTSCCCSR